MQTIEKIQVIQSNRPPREAVAPRYPVSLRLIRFAFATLGRLFPGPMAQLAFRLFTTPRKRAKHKVSDAILEQAEVFDFLYGAQMLKGYQWGTGDRIILLVHGWESRGTALRSFVPALVKQGFKVVAFDAPAHGNSGFTRTTLPHYGGAIRAIINRVGGVYGVIAHSFGGASTVFTLANLDNSIEIKRMVMVACPSNFADMLDQFLRAINAPPALAKRFENIVSSVVKVPISEANVSHLMPKAKIEDLLVVHDRHDQVVPFAQGELIANTQPNSQMLISKGWGHFALMKNEEIIERVTHFIIN